MNVLIYNHKSYLAPEGWHDCTPEHWGSLVGFSRLPADARTPDVVDLAGQIGPMITPQQWERWELDAGQWEAMQDLFAWVFTPPTTRPFERFSHEGQEYHCLR